jgi:SOS response regulatory protein OraA/RecX
MLALAREALEKFDNNVDAAISYLSQRLRDDSELREALVKSAVEYESLEELHS